MTIIRKFSLAAALVASTMALAPAAAFDVLPTITVLELPADSSGSTLTVGNPRTVPLPVTVEIFERTVNEDGTEERVPADDLFLVFPPQAVVPAGGEQAIRLRWIGPPPERSRSFTLYIGEVPVDMTATGQSGVQRILRIGASVHVTPAKAQARPRVAEAVPDGDGMRVTLINDGDRFIYLNELALDFEGKSVGADDLASAAQRTLLPPGSRRTFTVSGVRGTPSLRVIG